MKMIPAEVAHQIGISVPGLALVVVQHGEIVVSQAWGDADISSGAPMTPDTACNWFSMTKPATATIALQLAEHGLLDLDAPIEHYYPPFANMRPASRSRVATVRNLLSHSSGLANPTPLRWVHLASESGPDRNRLVLSQLEKHRRLRFDPGSRSAYSNLGYLVLGEVIESASGQRFEQFMHENLLAPLGMQHTGFTISADTVWATPYHRRRTGLNMLMPFLVPRRIIGQNEGRFRSFNHFYLDGAPYGGLVGPAVDAARFVAAHLGDGEWDGIRVLSAESVRSMRRIVAHSRRGEVALGWYRMGRNPDPGYVEHLGGGAGFWNSMRIYPKQNTGIITMGNATTYDHETIVRTALSTLD